MPKLQTIVNFDPPAYSISYSDKILLLGSCFSQNIGQGLNTLKFKALTNPFGVIYNPASVAQSLDLLINKNTFNITDLNFHKEVWFSFNHHTLFNHPDKQTCLNGINRSFTSAKSQIKNLNLLFITLGTAWTFNNKKTGKLVANCHKIPASEFERKYLSPEDIIRHLSKPLNELKSKHKDIQFVFTVSPIRHWKDGAIENMRSKSSLLLAIKELERNFSNLYYFPVYEIFMDELRDYRFYASDLLHPSEIAISCIWERFYETFLDKKTQKLANEVEKLVKSFNHRPMNTFTKAFEDFTSKLKSKTSLLTQQYPFLDFSEELKLL